MRAEDAVSCLTSDRFQSLNWLMVVSGTPAGSNSQDVEDINRLDTDWAMCLTNLR